jgi:hypothetical protein
MPPELRWIFENAPPSQLMEWFLKGDSLGCKVRKQIKKDTYLFLPEASYFSVKFRGNDLDIRWKRSSFHFKFNSRGLEGTVKE